MKNLFLVLIALGLMGQESAPPPSAALLGGTTANTLAFGNDSRIVGAAQVNASGYIANLNIQTVHVTVATLPVCGATTEGLRASVTDATAPSFLGALTGGGTVHAPAYCNGTAWVAG